MAGLSICLVNVNIREPGASVQPKTDFWPLDKIGIPNVKFRLTLLLATAALKAGH